MFFIRSQKQGCGFFFEQRTEKRAKFLQNAVFEVKSLKQCRENSVKGIDETGLWRYINANAFILLYK